MIAFNLELYYKILLKGDYMDYIDKWIDIIENMRYDKSYKAVWGLSIIKCVKNDTYLTMGDTVSISLNNLYLAFIEYYWNHSIDFNLSQGQSSSIMNIIKEMQDLYKNEFGKIQKWIQASKFFDEDRVLFITYINKIHNVCKTNVIPRFLVTPKCEQMVYIIDLENKRLIFNLENIQAIKIESTYLQRILVVQWMIILLKLNESCTLQYADKLYKSNDAVKLLKEKFIIKNVNYNKEKTYEDYIFTYSIYVFSLLYFFDSACVKIGDGKRKLAQLTETSATPNLSMEENIQPKSPDIILVYPSVNPSENQGEFENIIIDNSNEQPIRSFDLSVDSNQILETEKLITAKLQDITSLEYYEGELYYCSVHISIPVVDLVRRAYDFVIQGEYCFRDLMLQLRNDFHVKNMHTRNLRRLIRRFFNDIGYIVPIYEKKFYYPNCINSEEIKVLNDLYNLVNFFGKKNFLDMYFQKTFEALNCFINKEFVYNYTNLDKFIIPFINVQSRFSFHDFLDNEKKIEIGTLYREFTNQYNDLLLNYVAYSFMLLEVCAENLELKLEVIGIEYDESIFQENKISSLIVYFKGDTDEEFSENFLDYYEKRLEKLVLIKEFFEFSKRPLLQVIFEEGCKFIDKNADAKKLMMVAYKESMTLQDIGTMYGVTRERVRQIISQTTRRLYSYMDTYFKEGIFARTIKSLFGYEYCISSDEMFSALGDFGTALFYSTKQLNQGYAKYLEKLDCICLGDETWYQDLMELINKFPTTFYIDDIDELMINFDYNISREIVIKTIKLVYINYGNVFSKSKMTKTEKTLLILKKYFVNGYKIRDESVMKLYKEKHYKEFADEEVFTQSSRSIDARVERNLVPIGKALYNHPDNIIDISMELINRIENHIDNIKCDFDGFHYKSIFLEFEESLIAEGINDPYMLREVMKKQIEKYYYDRDSFSKTYNNNLLEDLFNYCREFEGIFDIRELVEKHFSYNIYFVQNQLSIHPEFVVLYGMKAIKIRNIEFFGLKSDMRKLIDARVDNGKILNSSTMVDLFNIKFPDFMDENDIKSSSDLYNIMKKVFEGKYNFKKPYITDIDTEIDSTNNMIAEYLDGMKFVNITNFKKHLEDNEIRINSVFDFIISLSDRYAWIDREKLVSWNQINLDETKIIKIGNILESLLARNSFISLKTANFDMYFPELNMKYTELLVVSIIRKNFTKFRLISTINQYPTAHFYIVKNESKIKDYQDIQRGGY